MFIYANISVYIFNERYNSWTSANHGLLNIKLWRTGDRYNACDREAWRFQRWSFYPPSLSCQRFPSISNPNVPANTKSLMSFGKLISDLGGPGGLIVQTASMARCFLISYFEENWKMQIWLNCRQIWTTMQLPCGLWHHRGGDVYLQ